MKRCKTPRTVTLKDDWARLFGNHWQATEWFKRLDDEELPYPVRPIGHWGCNRCGQDRHSHNLWYTQGCGMGSLCEVCWEELATPAARTPWYRAQWLSSEMGRLYRGCPYGSHTDGFPPFEAGHYSPEWREIQAALASPIYDETPP